MLRDKVKEMLLYIILFLFFAWFISILKQIITPNGVVGVNVYMDENNQVFISELTNDMPADKAGLEVGDYIIKVNNEPMINKNHHYVASKIRGQADSEVKILIKRSNIEQEHIIKRAKRKINWNPLF